METKNTTYRYANYEQFEDMDADQLIALLCDIPIEIQTVETYEVLLPETYIPAPSPRSTTRTTETLQRLQSEVEKIRYLHMQQAEEIYFLKSKIDRLEEAQRKNINLAKKIPHGQGQRIHTKKANTGDLSSTHLDHPRQTKSRRLERLA